MAKYSIAEVEHLTGIHAHTLRIWERRYELIKAKRTETKIRFYDDSQLKLLLNVSILLKNGYKVSAIDKMPQEEILEITQRILTHDTDAVDKDIQGLTLSMLSLDESLFNQIYQTHFVRNGLKKTVMELFYPFLHQVGVLWRTNRAMPAQEHFISNLLRRKLFSAIENLPKHDDKAPKLVMFLPEGEYHEVGLLLSYYLAKEVGYNVYYLGQNVPSEDVLSTIELVDAEYAMTIVLISRSEYENQVKKICGGKVKVLVAGKVDCDDSNVIKLNSPDDFLNFLKMNFKSKHSV